MSASSGLKNNNGIFHSTENCRICHKDMTQEVAIHRESFQFGVICSTCYVNNSEEDIDLMSNMFMAFGGFFGMLKDPNFSVNEMLKDLLSEISLKKGKISPMELKLRLLYLALLHGITPQEFAEWDENLLKYMYHF